MTERVGAHGMATRESMPDYNARSIGPDDGRAAILATPMSFAAAVYSTDKKDVAIGAYGLWSILDCSGKWIPYSDPIAVKCLRLSDRLAIALTGSADLIRDVLAKVYSDDTIRSLAPAAVGRILNADGRTIGLDMGEVASILDACIPEIVASAAGTWAADDLSVIVAGRHWISGAPHIMGWSIETEWRCEEHDPSGASGWGFCTIPADGVQYTDAVKAILNDEKFGRVPSLRVRRAISLLSGKDDVATVGGTPTVRTLFRQFHEV